MDDDVDHAEGSENVELDHDVSIFQWRDVVSVEGSDAVGIHSLEAASRSRVHDDEGNDDQKGEDREEGLLEAAENVDHNAGLGKKTEGFREYREWRNLKVPGHCRNLFL